MHKRIYDTFGSELETMDIHSGTGTEILEIHDDSEETVASPTDRDDDSNAEMSGSTDIDNDDDDFDDHDDGPSPRLEHPTVGVSDIPCDPLVTQEEGIRLDEGVLVENLNVS